MTENNEDLIAYSDDDDHNEVKAKKGDEKARNNTGGGYSTLHATGFKDFLLKTELIRAISEAGFEHPSEVQINCIPRAIEGKDLLCQAKSGMGKTAVFVLSLLQLLDSKSPEPLSALVLCHTKELAHQINREIVRLGKYLPAIKSTSIVGGDPIEDQVKMLKNSPPTIVVGTPGRILDLVGKKHLDVSKLKFFILDECDIILEQIDMRKDIQKIFTETPQDKQVMMFSATMSPEIKKVCRKFMQNQEEIFIDDEAKLTLHGLIQYYVNIKEEEKSKKLIDLLDNLSFNQVIIFVRTVPRAIHLNKILVECSFPSIAIHSQLTTEERRKNYNLFKEFQKRLMVSTDVFARGVDFERINIVINYDMPQKRDEVGDETDTYLHRVGRAGRFGTKGLAITFVSTEEEKVSLKKIQDRFVVTIPELPDEIETDAYMNKA